MEEFRIYTDWKFDLRNAEYEPTIKDVEKGIIVEPMKCARSACQRELQLFVHAGWSAR